MTMRQIANLAKQASAVFALCAVTAVALTAQIFRTLLSFDGTDGEYPLAGLVQATNGDLYGTTEAGGVDPYYVYEGTVFKMTAGGALTSIYSFCAPGSMIGNCIGTDSEGGDPLAALVQATNGDLYGTTSEGGANGGGTVFKITPSGTLTTLYSFCSQSGCTDGAAPTAGLVQARDGNFYGTTAGGYGTVFKITPSGTLTTLHSFSGTDGATPWAGLIQGTDGNLYGTTLSGGANGDGTAFCVTTTGTLTTLYSFGSGASSPYAGLCQDTTNGRLYGTTYLGGANSAGTYFTIPVP